MSRANKLRWGILGCANIAFNKVIPAIQQSETGEVAAIASRSLDKAEAKAKEHGIPKAYGSYQELLNDPDIDAVYIPLPNHLHREWTIRAARAKKHVLCEKPASLSERHAVQMIEACEQQGVLFAEAFMYRHHPRLAMIRDVIRSGEIGEVVGMHGVFTFHLVDWQEDIRFQPEMGGGAIYDVGVYPISAARYLLDAEPEAAYASAKWLNDVDAMVRGVLEFPGAVAVTFECGMQGDFRNTLQVVGRNGRIDVDPMFVPGGNEGDFTVVSNGVARTVEVPKGNPYVMQVDDFARAVLEGTPLKFDPMDAVRNMRVVDACLKSARDKARIEVVEGEYV